MRTEIIITNIDAVSFNTKAKLNDGATDVITTVSFQCRVKALDLMRLASLIKQNPALNATFSSRQATFDWIETPDGENIRKIREHSQAELGLPKNDLIPVPLIRDEPSPNQSTDDAQPLCERCACRDSEECIEADAYNGSVTQCTSFRAKPEDNGNGNGNGHHESTRYVPDRPGEGRRAKKAVRK